MREKIERKLKRIAINKSEISDKYEFGLLDWRRMDDNIYATFIRKDKDGNFMKIQDVYKIDWLI